MDTVSLETGLDVALQRSKGSRALRLLRAPARLAYSEVLEKVTAWFGTSIEAQAITFWGDTMTVLFPEQVSMGIYRYRFFEGNLTRMLLRYLKPGMTFIDIGAHLGYHTLLAAKIVGRTGMVHPFEPTPYIFSLLQQNVGQRRNVRLNNLAVSSEESTILLNDYGPRFSAYNSVTAARLDASTREPLRIKVCKTEAISLDAYINEIGVPSAGECFVKIDAESSEYEILRGMEETLCYVRPIITMEVGDKDIEGIPRSKELIAHLIERDYSAYRFIDAAVLPLRLSDRYEYDNILFLPQPRRG